MRKAKLNPEEVNIVFTAVNYSNPQSGGITLAEVREGIPVLEKIEKDAEKIVDAQGNSRIIFKPTEIYFKESEHAFVIRKLESATWGNLILGRQALEFINKFKELPVLPDDQK